MFSLLYYPDILPYPTPFVKHYFLFFIIQIPVYRFDDCHANLPLPLGEVAPQGPERVFPLSVTADAVPALPEGEPSVRITAR